MKQTAFVVAATLLGTQGVPAADLARQLRNDPFAMNGWPPQAAATVGSASGEAQTHPPLRAVLVAGAESRVVFGSQPLRIGESSGDYRLLQVLERSAIFDLGGKRVEIGLRGTVLP
jgi:hypothetical protein